MWDTLSVPGQCPAAGWVFCALLQAEEEHGADPGRGGADPAGRRAPPRPQRRGEGEELCRADHCQNRGGPVSDSKEDKMTVMVLPEVWESRMKGLGGGFGVAVLGFLPCECLLGRDRQG